MCFLNMRHVLGTKAASKEPRLAQGEQVVCETAFQFAGAFLRRIETYTDERNAMLHMASQFYWGGE